MMIARKRISHMAPRLDEAQLLERLKAATRIPTQLDCPEEEVHHAINSWESHSMTYQRCEVALCTALTLHHVAFHKDLGACERECSPQG